ncbi:uncharacterized protein LOC112056110 isoform X2 [Bicyclus anynana]|uniref:Uncharacterized protein LOC112056110 isoform X2 n=1 Tax=Bicyclus anynana TaxID=110368 RepID=A0A6J1NXA7_BICAN|nr:uncharacterized protein LOC112056110 isoform X2 [Bicyclus anynana]
MDLKEIIKWFIPCFHRLLYRFARKLDLTLTFPCLFLLFFCCPSYAAKVNSVMGSNLSLSNNLGSGYNYTKNVEIVENDSFEDQSVVLRNVENAGPLQRDTSVGRTFGIRFKKMMQAMIPLAFQLGSAATWAVIAALVGIKTLAVTLFIVKILLVAGAAKLGALFASKGHHGYQSHQGWTPHQKEIHLHIHNNGYQGHGTEHESISPWNRDGVHNTAESNHVNIIHEPYAAGPQTISTPYGNYMRIEPGQQAHAA